uniref:Putative portal protein n=1 Tax=viral metagenome TaxID=1070528 RepID=A0A6M3J4B5_9ZZZZ
MPIDPGRLITPTDATVKKEIFDGVEIGKDGEIKALYIRKDGKTGYFYSAKLDDCDRVEVTNAKTGLPNILTVCDVRNVSEYRNDSILGSMIKELKDSNDLADAAVVKALVSNIWTAFVESEGEATRLMNRQGTNSDLSADDWENRIQELDKGTLLFGQPGEKATFLDSKAPGDNYAMMWDSIVGRLGMATGRGAENVKRTYTASYSASRANIEDAEKFDDYDRMILTNRFCQPAFSMLLFEAATRDLLPVKNIGHFQENLYAYTRTNWLRPPIRPIDHAKEANADTTRLGNHTKSYSDIYGERSKDWKPALRQKAIELKYIQDLEAEFGVSMILHPETMSNIIDNNGGDN